MFSVELLWLEKGHALKCVNTQFDTIWRNSICVWMVVSWRYTLHQAGGFVSASLLSPGTTSDFDLCRPSTCFTAFVNLYLYHFCCVCKALFPLYLPSPLLTQSILSPFQHSSLNSERINLMKISHLGLNVIKPFTLYT